MANKVVALFVEGPTEIEFYKAVIKYAHDVMQTKFDCSFEWLDMHGIGNYKNDALRKFKNTFLQRTNAIYQFSTLFPAEDLPPHIAVILR